MSSENPATPLTRTQYRDSCTSVLMGIDTIYRHGIIMDDPLDVELKQVARMIEVLRPEVDENLEYYVDGPLVRFLTARVNKISAIVREIRRACSARNVNMYGESYHSRHCSEHLEQLKEVRQELDSHYQNTVIRNANLEEARKQHHREALARSKWGTAATEGSVNALKTPGSSQKSVTFDGAALDPAVRQTLENSAVESTEAYERSAVGQQPHSNTWPEDEPWPPRAEMRTEPPFVDGRVRDLNTYKDLPQFTGIDLPVPNLPDAELGFRATHTQHWDHHNTVMY
ncbi:uncharacterized protein [Ptychodera flava]|uniref:uncharacterized protein n=1 Tax=Ptychodera flava TaxID=63121 RepID=UPI00396AABBF